MDALRFKKPVVIREVWENNLEREFSLIQQFVQYYSYISIDTEFPGVLYYPKVPFVNYDSPSQCYNLMKSNVDVTKIIQLGFTLTDPYGNLPTLGNGVCMVWQFNFREFDIDKDPYNHNSIELLKRQGIDFERNKKDGISALHFSKLFCKSFLPRCYPATNLGLTWVSFHGAYDFGYLIKLLTQSNLPNDLHTFMDVMCMYLGVSVYDSKVMLKSFGFHGGLEKMARCLGIDRRAGKRHQAGSDSLLTMQIFLMIKKPILLWRKELWFRPVYLLAIWTESRTHEEDVRLIFLFT